MSGGSRIFAAAMLGAAGLGGAAAQAQESAQLAAAGANPAGPPLWEVGVAAGAGAVPDYPSSDRYRLRVIPFPYFIYRGHFLRSDEKGARLRAELRSNIEVDVSGGASFATHSSGSGPRQGMPDLDYMLELGPNLRVIVARPAPGERIVTELPLRAVMSTNGRNYDYRGLVFSPDVGWQTRSLFGSPWRAYANIGPEFASARFQDYFYQVGPQYARPGRPAYDAHGGYFGSRLELGVNRPLAHHVRVFWYGRFEDYAGAENAGSPLFQSHEGYVTFVGFSWAFWQSQQRVPPVDEQ